MSEATGLDASPRLLTVKGVARRFRARPEWVRRKLIGEGVVLASRADGRLFVRAEDVERALAERRHALNRDGQRRLLEGVADSLSGVCVALETIAADARRLRDEADDDCPFAEEALDDHLCKFVECACALARKARRSAELKLAFYPEEDEA